MLKYHTWPSLTLLAGRPSCMDRLSPDHRSWNMGRIRGRDTLPEKRVRGVACQTSGCFRARLFLASASRMQERHHA